MIKSRNEKIRDWFYENADSRLSHIVLSVVAFTDGFISPLPPDPFLGLMAALKPARWVYFTLLTLFWSVLGGVAGYLIGFALYETIGEYLISIYNSELSLQNISEVFQDNTFIAIFIAALTPIPYQIFTVLGGVFKINFISFLLASITGRGIRYFAVAIIMKIAGEKFGNQILKYLNWLLLIGGLVIISYIILTKF
jgi:membrane protein YqaA with SNARE-associated domain